MQQSRISILIVWKEMSFCVQISFVLCVWVGCVWVWVWVWDVEVGCVGVVVLFVMKIKLLWLHTLRGIAPETNFVNLFTALEFH